MIFVDSPDIEAARAEDPCQTFWWIGQDFAYCERCSRPYWVHLRTPGVGDEFNTVKLITDAQRRACWTKWHPDRPRTFGMVDIADGDREPLMVGDGSVA